MKKGRLITIAILVVLVGGFAFLQSINFNRFGAQQYYVQVQDGTKMEGKTSQGEKYIYYEYTLNGFDKDGKEKGLTFTADKQLRKDAYLRVYVKKDIVSSYQEVQLNELPEQAKQELDRVNK